MANTTFQNLSFSFPTLLVLSGCLVLVFSIYVFFLWNFYREDFFRRKLSAISDPIRKQMQHDDESIERAKLLAKVAALSEKSQKVSLNKSFLLLIKALKRKEILTKLLIVVFAYFLIFVTILKINTIATLAALPVVFLITLRWLVNRERNNYYEKVVEQLPMSIDLLVRSLEAGLNVNNAITMCAAQLDEPIKSEFASIQRDMTAGLNTPDAFEKFYERVPRPSVAFLLALIAAQNKSGGSLAGGLSVLSETLRARRSVQSKLEALTSEPRTSMKVLLAIPAVFTVVSFIAQPEKTTRFITTTEGQLYLVPMVIWSFIGVYVMLKMTEIRD